MAKKRGKSRRDSKSKSSKEQKNNEVGRPREWTYEKINEEILKMYDWFLQDEGRLFIEEYTLVHMMPENFFREKISEYPVEEDQVRLQANYDQAKMLLKVRLMKGALTGRLRDAPSIFLLKANYGVTDKIQPETDNEDVIFEVG